MKGTIVDIKFAEHSRVATYGIALGDLLYCAWSGLVRFLAPRDFDVRGRRGWR
jgi:hypothetical protein